MGLIDEVWGNQEYYNFAHKGSLDVTHPGIIILNQIASNSKRIIDLGCGEGTRLSLLKTESSSKLVGVDISSTALKIAKKAHKNIEFIEADLEKLPFKDEEFDLVYSAYVLEHISDPNKVVNEAVRVLSEKGYLILIAPNYGAPNRCSPPFKGSRVLKLISGFLRDFFSIKSSLNWSHVKPIANRENYEIDWDTTVEPYLGSLVQFLKEKGLHIENAFSCWEKELPNARLHQKLFKLLGNINVYPFWMWGPHLVIVAKKV